MNQVLLIGRTTRKPELRQTARGMAVTTFTLAVNRTFKNEQGIYETDFINCIVFNKIAETIEKYVDKGDLLAVNGRLQTRSYQADDGTKKYIFEVVVNNVDFLEPKKEKQTEPKKEEHYSTEQAFIDFGNEIEISDDDLAF